MTTYEHHNYTDLGIVSAKKPWATWLWWVISDSLWYMVDSTNQKVLLKSTDKGDNWSTVTTRDKSIQSGWNDGTVIHLVDCANDGANDEYDVWNITIDGNDTITDVLTHTESDSDYIYMGDIFKIGSDILVMFHRKITSSGLVRVYVYDVTSSPAVYKAQNNNVQGSIPFGWYRGRVGGNYFYTVGSTYGGDNRTLFIHYNHSSPAVTWYQLFDGYNRSTNPNQWGMAIGSTYTFYIAKKVSDGKYYLMRHSTVSWAQLGEMDVCLTLDRDTDSTADPPNNLEKAFHVSEDKVYQVPSVYTGKLNLISSYDFEDVIIGMTDRFLMDDSGNVYEYVDLISSILEGMLYHSRQNYPYLKLKFNSDNITIVPQQFIQIIGSYTADGTIYQNKVVFEGIAEAPTEGRIQYALIKNQGYEMDEVKPDGSKAGRSDQIITDINNDGAPSGPEYIRDGTLSVGGAMGTLIFNKSKVLRKVYNEFAEHDGFTWALRPKGDLDYNAGGVDSGADIRYDGSTYFDSILQLKAWKVAKLNQIIVNGAINTATGILYTGQWNDVIGQQENGINSITVEDAQLNSDALCQAKADSMGAGETERTRARFKFRKTTYGFIQPGQTITFKYVITNYMTIAEAQFILDKIIMNIKSEVGYAEISSEL